MPLKAAAGAPEAELSLRFAAVRARSLSLAAPLSAEDAMVQSMPDCSPAKWHLAHTSWFFEQFLLTPRPGHRPYDERLNYLFNSYYQSVGAMHARPARGLLTRPSLDEVRDYRAWVDERVARLLDDNALDDTEHAIVRLGTEHEQQHQELLLTDIKHAFSCNPLLPAYHEAPKPLPRQAVPLTFVAGAEGIVKVGHAGEDFSFDNEGPRHRVLLLPHALANRPVTNAEYLAFIADGGYRTPTLWLSDGWDLIQREGWQRPLYWQEDLASEFTLAGVQPLDPNAPVSHVSYFEADAFAHWTGARLLREEEWEHAASGLDVQGNLQDTGRFHPLAAESAPGLLQMFGDVWEWTMSAYTSYPAFRTAPGALGEYNGKFMNGQWVLRGGSCATPASHLRASYRNFFPPHARWQFSGIRLGQDR
ncbi:ergothioneine biosynthesis protein EgtB [Pinirhizobacter sp.]|jgi:ergothioneine biosynthesis protein EgtB|uniref:ergothioneine biosynthesis protein EgtB n=1 Tax=Pinirhizobacter sp. TaxID=2950432 RepID=UPI002F3FFEE4